MDFKYFWLYTCHGIKSKLWPRKTHSCLCFKFTGHGCLLSGLASVSSHLLCLQLEPPYWVYLSAVTFSFLLAKAYLSCLPESPCSPPCLLASSLHTWLQERCSPEWPLNLCGHPRAPLFHGNDWYTVTTPDKWLKGDHTSASPSVPSRNRENLTPASSQKKSGQESILS